MSSDDVWHEVFSQTPEHLAEAAQSGDATGISDLNQAGVKRFQMTTGSKNAPGAGYAAPHLHSQSRKPQAET